MEKYNKELIFCLNKAVMINSSQTINKQIIVKATEVANKNNEN